MNYIVRTKNQIYAFYFIRERGIIRRVFKNFRWSAEQTINKNAKENFSVGLKGEKIYLFCQDDKGDILLTKVSDEEENFINRVVVKNDTEKFQPIFLHPIFTENGLAILYNSQDEDERNANLILQTMQEGGKWQNALNIDKFIPFQSWYYEAQHVTNEHLLLFYQTREAESLLGYREITPHQQGPYHVFYNTKYFIVDSAYLTTHEDVHALIIIKNMFSYQLIYRKKGETDFETPIIIYEAQRMEKCLLACVKNCLYVFFLVSGQLFVSISEDNGKSFKPPVRYKNKFCQTPEKAFYLTQEPQSTYQLFIRQIFVDRISPWDIQIISDIYEDFYSTEIFSNQMHQDDSAVETIPSVFEAEKLYPNNAHQINDHQFGDYKNGEQEFLESQEKLERYKNQVSLLKKQCQEKDQQIIQLTYLIERKNKELAKLQKNNWEE